MGYNVPLQVPPIGAVAGNFGGGAFGDDYNAAIILPGEDLKLDLSNAVRHSYGSNFFFNAIKEPVFDQQSGGRRAEAAEIYADYYRCSFAGERKPYNQYNLASSDLEKWGETLWYLRHKYGQEFMDHALYFALVRWAPYGTMKGEGTDFDSFFSWRLLAGVAVLDNNAYPFNDIHIYLKDKGLLK